MTWGKTMKIFMGLMAFMMVSTQALAASSPASVFITIYAIGISTAADCSNPTIVSNYGTSGKRFDFAKAPFLGGAQISDGTYNCVILQMSDQITFTTSVADGSCAAGSTYTIDVCRTDNSCNYIPLTISGTTGTYGSSTAGTGTGTSVSADKVTLFLSTQSTGNGQSGGSFLQPTTNGSTNGFNIANPFVVSGSKSGIFVANFTNKMNGTGASCDVSPPVFGFR